MWLFLISDLLAAFVVSPNLSFKSINSDILQNSVLLQLFYCYSLMYFSLYLLPYSLLCRRLHSLLLISFGKILIQTGNFFMLRRKTLLEQLSTDLSQIYNSLVILIERIRLFLYPNKTSGVLRKFKISSRSASCLIFVVKLLATAWNILHTTVLIPF